MTTTSRNIDDLTGAMAVVTDENLSALEGAVAELADLAEPVRRACIRAYRALAILQRSFTVNDDEAHEPLYAIADRCHPPVGEQDRR